jgi:tRNA U55 pseudouridine synthase TruB
MHILFEKMDSIKSIITYKPPGLTMIQFIKDFRILNEKKQTNGRNDKIDKICFAGRLDPMARGKILLLFNDECKKINEYKSMAKTYQFRIILGIQTDSDDPLGIIENIQQINCKNNYKYVIGKLHETIISKINSNSFLQKFHNYSSKCIDRQPLWYYKKNNISIDVPSHEVSIYDYQIDSNLETYDYNKWSSEIISQIDKIDHACDFNQQNIIDQWSKNQNLLELYAIPVTLTVSSGFYIRQFVRDFSNEIDYPLLTYDINRLDFVEKKFGKLHKECI